VTEAERAFADRLAAFERELEELRALARRPATWVPPGH